jgi:palmitoyltransferase
MKLTKCTNCFVVRPINTHHCSVCHKCVIEQDHHCPWVNNCIGLFNKKIFILFLFYGTIEVIYSVLLFFYYQLYKNINTFKNEPFLIVLDIFAIIFGLILAIVSLMLLYDQYDTIIHSITQCDFKEGLLLEKSTVDQQINLIFGGKFNFRWFLPFYPGGNINKYNELIKKRETNSNDKAKNE